VDPAANTLDSVSPDGGVRVLVVVTKPLVGTGPQTGEVVKIG